MSILLFNEVKLNRNLDGYNFPSKIKSEDAFKIVEELYSFLGPIGYEKKRLLDMSPLQKLKYFEDYGLNSDMFKNEVDSAIFTSEELPTIMINGKDHIEISNVSVDKSLGELYGSVSNLDDFIDSNVKYAFREDFGYLTSDPMNCGGAMRPYSCVHLPATAYFGISSLIRSLDRLGYSAKTLNSENKTDVGAIYKISPNRTIGKPEEEYTKNLETIVEEIIDIEKQNRERLYLDRIIELEDIVNRALGILKNARIISEEEMIDQFSKIVLGIELSVIKPNREIKLLETINNFKNAHIQIEKGTLLDKRTRNILRANNIRKMMKEVF